MESNTFGQRLKQEIIQAELRIEKMGEEFGTDTQQYKEAFKVLEAKRKYVESIAGNQAPDQLPCGVRHV